MFVKNEGSITPGIPAMRIVGLKTDRIRKTVGSHPVYRAYFELSEIPTSIWSDVFGRVWKNANPAQEAKVDGKFLVIHCPLQETAMTRFPALRSVVKATNIACKTFSP